MPIGYWPSKPDRVVEQVSTLAGGINQMVDPIELLENQPAVAANMDSLLSPTLAVRDGYTKFSNAFDASNLVLYKNKYYRFNSFGFVDIAGGTYYYSVSGPTNLQWSYSKFYDGSVLYFVPGSGGTPGKLQSFNGTTVTEVTAAPAAQSFVASHSNRLFLAGVVNNLLHYSGLRDANDWSSTDPYTGSGSIAVETEDGETPRAIVGFAGSLILFKRYTMHKLFGDDSTNFTMTNPYAIGCVSAGSIVKHDGMLYWLASDGIYAYDGGTVPTKISQAIDPIIKRINGSNSMTCSAGTDGRFLYFSFTVDGETFPSLCYKFDLQTGTWWPVSFVPRCYLRNDKSLLFYLPPSSGIEQGVMTMGGPTDGGRVIPWEVQTRPMSTRAETRKKALHRMYAVIDLDPASTLDVSYATGAEGNVWTPVYTTTNGTGQAQSIRIPVIQRPIAPFDFYRVRIMGTGQARIHRLITEMTRRGN